MLLTASERQATKRLALDDFYYFMKSVLGYDLLNGCHEDWVDKLVRVDPEGNRLWNRRLILKPRGTYKSTVYTVAYPLWRAIKEPDKAILITNAVADNANDFLYEIKAHIERNDKFRYLFGNLKNSARWKEQSIILNSRKTSRKEGNIVARGALSQIVSAHYDLIICDDIVNNDDRESATIREKKKRWVKDVISLLNPGGEMIVVGTRWHPDDLYNTIIKDTNPKLAEEDKYSIEVSSALNPDGSAAFPDILPLKDLDRLRIEKGLIEFASQYLNDPQPAECQIFNIDQMHFFDPDDVKLEDCTIYGACDPSMGASKSADYSAIPVLARDEKTGVVYVMECSVERRHPDKIIKDIIDMAGDYKFKRFVVEENQFQKYFKDQLIKEATAAKSYLPIKGIVNTTKKETRIQSLQPFVANGMIKFRKDWRQAYPLLIDQMIYFPLGHDDAPDAIEMAFREIVSGTNPRIRSLA